MVDGEQATRSVTAAASGALAGGFLDSLLVLGSAKAAGAGAVGTASTATGVATAPVWVPAAVLGSICAAAIWAHAAMEGRAGRADRERFNREFQRILGETGNLRRVLEKVSARQLDAELDHAELASSADDILRLLRDAQADRQRAERDHDGLLIYIARHLDERFDAASDERKALEWFLGECRREVNKKLDSLGNDVRRSDAAAVERSDKSEQANERRHAEEMAVLHSLAAPRVDVDALLAEAARLVRAQRFLDARGCLDPLLAQPAGKLTADQRRRALANRAVVENVIGEPAEAARLFLLTADAAVEARHASAAAMRSIGNGILGRRQEAWWHARAAVRDQPADSAAWVAWVTAAPAGASLARIEAAVPAALRSNGDVAHACGLRAQRLGLYEDAARLHRAGAKYPEAGARSRVELGAVLLRTVLARAPPTTEAGVGEGAERLREGIGLLEAELAADWPWLDGPSRGTLNALLADAHLLLGETDKAKARRQQAYLHHPEDENVRLLRVEDLLEQGDIDAAVESARPLAGGEDAAAGYATLLLARGLRRRGRDADRREAAAVFARAVEAMSTSLPRTLRLELARGLASSGADAAASTIAGLDGVVLPTPAREALAALAEVRAEAARSVLRADDDDVSAWDPAAPKPAEPVSSAVRERLARAALALESEDGSGDDDLALFVADVLHDLGQHDLALPLYRRTLKPQQAVGPQTSRMLRSARLVGDEAFILNFCTTAREAGHLHNELAMAEVDVLVRYGAGERAVGLLCELVDTLESGPTARDVRYRLAALGLMLGRPDLFERDASRLPSPAEAGPLVGCGVAEVLRAAGEAAAAADYAYQLWRLNPNRPEAAAALVRAAHPVVAPAATAKGADIDAVVRPLTEVTAGCAVKLRVVRAAGQGEEEVWNVLEPSAGGAERLAHEVDAQADEGGRLLGLRPGSTFVYSRASMFGDDVATVELVLSAAAGRAMIVAEGFRRAFPDAPAPVEAMTLPKHDDGEIDVQSAWRIFDELARQDEERQAAAAALVSQHHLPASVVSGILGLPMVEVVSMFQRRKVRLVVSHGAVGEWRRAEEAILRAEALVLDPTAAAVLLLSGTWSRLDRPPPRPLVVARGTVRELRDLRRKLIDAQAAEAHMAWSAGHARFVENTPQERAARQRWIDDLDGFLAWLHEHATEEEGLALLELEPGERHDLIRYFGRPVAESVALAKRPGRLLWTDDARLGDHAQSQLGVEAVWSEAVVAADSGGKVARDAVHQLDAWLCRNRFGFTRIVPTTLAYEAAQADWDPRSPDLQAFIDGLFETGVGIDGFIALTAGSIMEAASAAPDWRRARAVIEAVLDRLDRTAWGRAIIRGLLAHAVAIWSHDVPAAVHVCLTIEGWFDRRAREIAWIEETAGSST